MWRWELSDRLAPGYVRCDCGCAARQRQRPLIMSSSACGRVYLESFSEWRSGRRAGAHAAGACTATASLNLVYPSIGINLYKRCSKRAVPLILPSRPSWWREPHSPYTGAVVEADKVVYTVIIKGYAFVVFCKFGRPLTRIPITSTWPPRPAFWPWLPPCRPAFCCPRTQFIPQGPGQYAQQHTNDSV
jgi:hypothetical protein